MHHSLLDRLGTALAALMGLTLWLSFLYNYATIISKLLPADPNAQTTLIVGLISVISAMTVELIHKLGPASAHTAEAIFGNLKRVAKGHLFQTYFWVSTLVILAASTLAFLPFSARDKVIGISVLIATLGYLPSFQRLQKHGRENAKKYLGKTLYGIWLGYLLLTATLPETTHTYLWVLYLGAQLLALVGALGISLISTSHNQFAPRWLLIKAGGYRDGIAMTAISGNKLAMQLYQDQAAPTSAKPIKNQANKALLLVTLLWRRNYRIVIPQIAGGVFTVFLYQYASQPAVYLGTALITIWSVNKLLPLWEDWATSEATQRMVLGSLSTNVVKAKRINYFLYLSVLTGLSFFFPAIIALALQAGYLWPLSLMIISLIGFAAHLHEKAKDLQLKTVRPPVITPDGMVIEVQDFSNLQTWFLPAFIMPVATIIVGQTGGLVLGLLLLGVYATLAKNAAKTFS
ncbi:MAG: hypothetical protein Q4D73_03020 [Actinomycetaceae bacterium]|nr:hypothetical protein [Actinomycetaceae bacterium]